MNTDYLWMIPAIIGITQAIKTSYPQWSEKKAPLIAVVVAMVLYLADHYIPADLFGLLIGVGSAMGLYTGIDMVRTMKVMQVTKSAAPVATPVDPTGIN